MTQKQQPENDSVLWNKLFESEMSFMKARQDFLLDSIDSVAMVKKVLENAGPTERGTALRLFEYLEVEELQKLFEPLLNLASVSHGDIGLVREAIHTLPREWVLSNIEKSAEPLLQNGTDEEYRRLLELYIEFDRDLTYRLAERALRSDDEDIRAAGEDAMKWLKNE